MRQQLIKNAFLLYKTKHFKCIEYGIVLLWPSLYCTLILHSECVRVFRCPQNVWQFLDMMTQGIMSHAKISFTVLRTKSA